MVPYLPMGWEESVMDVARMLRLWKDESADISEMLNTLEKLVGTRTS